MIRRVLVLGGGSAGFLAALALKGRLPQLDVTVLRSPEIGIIGVGEGTTVGVPNHLHGYLKLDPGEFHRAVRPTYKLGLKLVWGPRPYFNYTFSPQFNMQYRAMPRCNGYYCDDSVEYANANSSLMTLDKAFLRHTDGGPIIRNDVAYHMENAQFVQFLEAQALRRGARVVEETVASVEQSPAGIRAVACQSGRREAADFFVDCSGFFSLLLGKTLGEPFVGFGNSLFCDRALVGGWERGPDEPIRPYTVAQTMDAGWCWQIEHDHRINRGYVYCSGFVSDEEAQAEFRRDNPKVGDTRVVKFISGYYQRGWVKNVAAVGNACGFVEPLESTSLGVICEQVRSLAESLAETDLQPGDPMAAVYNKRNRLNWEDIRGFLAMHYRFNTRLETPFWRHCVEKTDLSNAREYVEFYRDNGPSVVWRDTLIRGHDVFGFEGYLTLMVGQAVPYRRTFVPSERDRLQWRAIQEANRAQAANGVSVKEAADLVRSPHWKYGEGFYSVG
jgi:tryptophan 7-halogenase